MTHSRLFFVPMVASCLALAALAPAANAQMRITEYMYSGTDGEFVEFTNIGNMTIDMTGWSYDDSSRTAGSFSLSDFGTLLAGESVILAEPDAATFRASWSLPLSVKVIGGNDNNLGRADEINLYDASSLLVDRLTYDDQNRGGPRAQNASATTTPANLGTNNIQGWRLSTVGDGDGSGAGTGGNIGSPGRSGAVAVAVPEADSVMLLLGALLPVALMVRRKIA